MLCQNIETVHCSLTTATPSQINGHILPPADSLVTTATVEFPPGKARGELTHVWWVGRGGGQHLIWDTLPSQEFPVLLMSDVSIYLENKP